MIDQIVSELSERCPALTQVARTDVVTTQGADTAELLTELLSVSFSGEFHPIVLPENSRYPASVYQLVSSKRMGPDNYEFVREDKYVLQIYAKGIEDLIGLVDTVRRKLLGYSQVSKAGSIEITDTMMDWEYDQNLYRAALELTFTHLATTSQSTPAAYVHSLRSTAGGDLYDPGTAQRITETVAVVLVCASEQIESIRKSLSDCLLGFQPDPEAYPISYTEGLAMGIHGHITVWREVYQFDRYVRDS